MNAGHIEPVFRIGLILGAILFLFIILWMLKKKKLTVRYSIVWFFAAFVLVLFAALTSAISLTETCVSIIQDGAGWSRKKALGTVIGVVVVAGIFVNLGYNGLSFIEPMGEGTTLLDFFDFISNSVIMPIVALLTCIFVGWIIKPKAIVDEVKISSEFKVEKAWTVIIKYVAPVLVVVILVAFVAQTFGLISF